MFRAAVEYMGYEVQGQTWLVPKKGALLTAFFRLGVLRLTKFTAC